MTGLLLAIIYLAFISLGLPDSLLGSAWPVIYPEFRVPVSWAGIVSMIISAGTVISSFQSDRLTLRFGTGRVTAASVAVTAAALLGFSTAHSFPVLCLWAIPYGLGAGSVDASLNNYVALHYASRHMSWLHCMWGIGASLGPYIMGTAITGGLGWNAGYRIIGFLQIALTAVLFLSLPLWKNRSSGRSPEKAVSDGKAPENTGKQTQRAAPAAAPAAPLALSEILRIPGVREILISFFCYSSLEGTAGLWASSYLALHVGTAAETAAHFAALFYLGITIGRAVSGFVTLKLSDPQMVRMGQCIIAGGLFVMLLPLGESASLAGLILTGLGCAPIYPSIIHSTPAHFGADRSQAVIGVQMASAYIGSTLMPPFFGWLAGHVGVSLYPFYLAALLILMIITQERLEKITKSASPS